MARTCANDIQIMLLTNKIYLYLLSTYMCPHVFVLTNQLFIFQAIKCQLFNTQTSKLACFLLLFKANFMTEIKMIILINFHCLEFILILFNTM